MASQIEQTLASLTALSEQYTAKIDSFFKIHDLSLQAVRSATLDSIEKAFRRFESDTLASRSPIKSLRKQTRRRLKKSTRSRKTKPKPRLQPSAVIASTHRGQTTNENTPPSYLPRPLQQRTLKVVPTKTQSEKHVDSSLLSPAANGQSEKCTPTSGKNPAKRSTRSTSSFQSAVESLILDLSTGRTTDDDKRYKGHSVNDMNHSPEINESQWEDCRPEPEQPTSRSKLLATGRGPVSVDQDPAGENASVVSPVLGGKGPSKARPLDKNRHKAETTFPQPSGTGQIDRGSSGDSRTSEEQGTNAHPSETDQLLESESMDEEELPAPIQRRKRGTEPVIEGRQPAQYSCDLIRKDNKSSMRPLPRDGDKITRFVKEKSKQPEAERKYENSANKNSSTSEDIIMSRAESATDGSRSNHKKSTDFEFKAPKPRPVPTIPASYPHEFNVQPATQQTSNVQQASSRLIERHTTFDVQKQNMVFQKQFAVDEGGKINDAGIGILSEIAATSSRGNEASIRRTGEERALRGTKLFKPTTDIYSSQRKPALSRMPSVQKSNMSSRGSLLSHTPGAHAPMTRLTKLPSLAKPSSSNLRESLAALKQPITDSKSTEPMMNGKTNSEAALNGEQNSLLQSSDEQGVQTLAGGKRLAFVEEYKQLDGSHVQPVRARGPQTAPTKTFRQPRIRRVTEKSALRRRIEEIRRKASTSTVVNRTTGFSSEENGRSAPAGNRNSGTSEAKCLASGTEQTPRSPLQSETAPVEREIVPSIPKPLNGVITAASSTESDEQHALAPESVSDREEEREPGFIQEKSSKTVFQKRQSGREISGSLGSCEQGRGENERTQEDETKGEACGSKTVLSNLMSSVASLYPGASSILGVRTNEERREETDAEIAAKKQRLDAERREAERVARIEAQRTARQKEAEEKQRRAEMRRQLLAEAEKAKEEERKRKEEHRKKVKQQEEEQRKRKKLEEDRKKEERRRQVLEKKALNMELQWKRTKGADGKRVKVLERSMTGLPKAGGPVGKTAKGLAIGRSFGKGISPTLGCKQVETEDGKQREENGTASYVMTPAKATVIEESDEEAERRKHKVIPQWAGEGNLAISAGSQPDPDKVFVNMPMCNLREVFGSSKQYRTRSSSANWTQDRVTTLEMTKYKKAVDGFDDV